MEEKIKNVFKAGSLLSLLVIGLVAGMLILSNSSPIDVTTEERTFQPARLTVVGDASPGSGASGVLRVVIVADGEYNWNQSFNATDAEMGDPYVYEYGDVNDTSVGTDVPYATSFSIGIKVRFNTTHAYESGVQWRMDWINGWCNCTDLSISSLNCYEQLIVTGTDYIWVWYIANASGSGYTISRGESVTDVIFNFNAYF